MCIRDSFFRVKGQTIQFRDAINHRRNGFAKVRRQLVHGHARVFDRVVQERTGNRDFVETQFSDNGRYRNRVGHVGFTSSSQLALVGHDGGFSRPAYEFNVPTRVKLVKTVNQRVEQGRQGSFARTCLLYTSRCV